MLLIFLVDVGFLSNKCVLVHLVFIRNLLLLFSLRSRTVSRFPILKSQKHFLSPEIPWNQKSFETEPRTLLETRIKIGKTIVRFMTTHLAYSHKFQTSQIKLRQIRTVLNLIESNKQYPSILCGDFNSLPESQEIKEIEKHLINVGKNSMNWTTYRNVSQANLEGTQGKIDYIFLSPEIKHKDLEIPETHLSDHLPVLVAVDL